MRVLRFVESTINLSRRCVCVCVCVCVCSNQVLGLCARVMKSSQLSLLGPKGQGVEHSLQRFLLVNLWVKKIDFPLEIKIKFII